VVGGGGTLSYAAPELLLGVRPTTCAVDVWAAGCLLAEMITGRVIFHASTVMQQVRLNLVGTRSVFNTGVMLDTCFYGPCSQIVWTGAREHGP